MAHKRRTRECSGSDGVVFVRVCLYINNSRNAVQIEHKSEHP